MVADLNRTRARRARLGPQVTRGVVRTLRVPTTVKCETHGVQPETFVCQHVAMSLRTGTPVGFYWAADPDNPRPDAWCHACNERVRKTGGEWVGDAAGQLGAKLLCGMCNDRAKRQCLGDDS